MIEVRRIFDRETWLGWRKEVLTASDIGAADGLDSYRSALSVYADKMGGIVADETPIMRRGRLFEAAAVEYLREEHPTWTIERSHNFYLDVDIRLGGTPDVVAIDDIGAKVNIQVKTVSAPTFEAWDGVPPKAYVLQTAAENYLTGSDRGILACLVVSTYSAELVEFEVPRHQAAERRICDIVRQFWKNVANGVVPKPRYDQDADIIDELFAPDEAVPVPLDLSSDNRIYDLLEDRDRLKKTVKGAEDEIKALDAELVHKLNGATLALANGWKITNKLTHRKEYVVKAATFPRLLTTRIEVEEAAA